MGDGLYEGVGLQGVDAKGRVAIPAEFRTTIEGNSAARIVIVGFHPVLPCLRAYDAAWSQSEEARFRKMAEEGIDPNLIAAERESVFGDVDRALFDPSGRFLLDDFMREEGKIKDLAFFAGAGPTFNIWAPDVLLATPEASERTRRRCEHLLAKKVRG